MFWFGNQANSPESTFHQSLEAVSVESYAGMPGLIDDGDGSTSRELEKVEAQSKR